MGWINVLEDGSLKFYSMSEGIESITEMVLGFWLHVTPGMIIFILVTFFMFIFAFLIYAIAQRTKNILRGF